jgi:hypothetical protein
VLELAAPELRVDRHERDARCHRCHDRDARLERRFRPHRHALGAVELGGQRGGGLAQLAVAEPALADRDGRLPIQLVDTGEHGPQASFSANV